eukprot:766983-Hanusia_phi.AAC.2
MEMEMQVIKQMIEIEIEKIMVVIFLSDGIVTDRGFFQRCRLWRYERFALQQLVRILETWITMLMICLQSHLERFGEEICITIAKVFNVQKKTVDKNVCSTQATVLSTEVFRGEETGRDERRDQSS